MPRAAFERIGGWDEGFFFYEEDIDLSVRIRRAGLEVWYLPDLRVIHGRGLATRWVRLPARLEAVRSRWRYIGKHFPPIQASVLRIVRLINSCFRAVGTVAAVTVTLGLHRGIRERAIHSIVVMVWIVLLMRPRWSLSGRA